MEIGDGQLRKKRKTVFRSQLILTGKTGQNIATDCRMGQGTRTRSTTSANISVVYLRCIRANTPLSPL